MILPLIAGFILLAISEIAPAQNANPDSIHRNNCMLAAQVLTTGHPAPQKNWALSYISFCSPTEKAAALHVALPRAAADADLSTFPLLSSSPVVAQGCAHATEDAPAELETLRPTFYSDDPADLASRGDDLRKLLPTEPAFIVTDARECTRVLARAIRYMREHDPTWAAGREGDFEANVLRFGPYYVVGIAAESPPATYENGVLNFDTDVRGKYIVLRERGLEVIRVFAGS